MGVRPLRVPAITCAGERGNDVLRCHFLTGVYHHRTFRERITSG
jgi:hypothetical protein